MHLPGFYSFLIFKFYSLPSDTCMKHLFQPRATETIFMFIARPGVKETYIFYLRGSFFFFFFYKKIMLNLSCFKA